MDITPLCIRRGHYNLFCQCIFMLIKTHVSVRSHFRFSHRGSAFCCSMNTVYGSLAPEVCVRSHESSWQCNHADGVAAVPALSTPLQLGSVPQPWQQLGRGYRHNASRRRWLGAACGEGKAPPACQHGCLVTGFSAGAQRCSGSVVQDHLFKVQ